jgi:hypothetical protein
MVWSEVSVLIAPTRQICPKLPSHNTSPCLIPLTYFLDICISLLSVEPGLNATSLHHATLARYVHVSTGQYIQPVWEPASQNLFPGSEGLDTGDKIVALLLHTRSELKSNGEGDPVQPMELLWIMNWVSGSDIKSYQIDHSTPCIADSPQGNTNPG